MLILAIDTSFQIASCALLRDGAVLDSAQRRSVMDHSRIILTLCDDMLKAQGIKASEPDIFAAVSGPGSFTGVRIGVAAAQGFAWASGKRDAGISSLLAAAYAAKEQGIVCARIQSRQNEFYYAFYEKNDTGLRQLTPESFAPAEDIAQHPLFKDAHVVTDTQSAANAALAAYDLWKREELPPAMPVYLKKPLAEKGMEEKA